eukprot:CAMPEP_0181177476 /NCGR_PEP_ID=MMETSP1096-20121128/5181_1 /TAXON_ID=156174 ORGANISM="Chrysochromulina ericina, Strain CCMP281" /NCGR_SAMPLE_ID=MMETSP1096 /ASSEMBLY_ACC=CAM_ASM_000453 /LENGTH=32 /DNA_ID= /DNA_START= /DNA_END= /DNA_ORIENTATION=
MPHQQEVVEKDTRGLLGHQDGGEQARHAIEAK